MSLTATGTINLYVSGDGVMGASTPLASESTTPTSNAPPPEHFTLQAGVDNMLILPPSSFTFSFVDLIAPAGSTNSKTVKGISSGLVVDATGLAGWTAGWVTLPAVAGGYIVINSTSGETLKAVYR